MRVGLCTASSILKAERMVEWLKNNGIPAGIYANPSSHCVVQVPAECLTDAKHVISLWTDN